MKVDIGFRVRSLGVDAILASQGRRESPLACLRDDALAARFHRWHGRSGVRYVATAYTIDHDRPIAGLPDLGPAVLIAVARRGALRDMVGLTVIECASHWTDAVTRLHRNADEWHVHLLAADRAARAAVLADLVACRELAIVA